MQQLIAICIAVAALVSTANAQGIWKVRDVAAKSAFVAADADGDVPSLHLKLDVRSANDRDTCTIIDTTDGERAVTLALCIPLDAIGGIWCDDPQTNRKIIATETKPYANLSDNAAGVTNEASLYPIAVIVDAQNTKATVLACPPDVPRMVRFVYDAPAKEMRAEFDFGLSPVPVKFPSRADAAIVRYEVPATWAFRRALQKYYELFPDAFVRRVKTGGIWMPFGETGGIKDAADFGFAFHEIADNQVQPKILADDTRIGCASYIYVEPQTYWQYFKGKGSGTYDERLAQLEADAKTGDRVSQATLVSGIIRASGKRDLYIDGVPYTTQLPWGQDPNPLIALDPARGYPNKGTYEFDRLEPLLGWRDKPNLGVAGIYVDSMEGWGEICNYNKEAWREAQAPLTFDPMNHNKVSLLNFWGVYAWVREMSTRLHAHQMTLFGNDAYFRRWQLATWVDVPGREYTWTDEAGKLAPVDDSHFLFLRSMSAGRPYLMLMNNRYEDGAIMEPYFQRTLFFGVFPSMFSGQQSASDVAYFSNPAWYNRDRALFKKYIPMIRKLDAAGWEPVPFASTEPAVRIERYGSFDHEDLAFTVHNTADHEQDITLELSRNDLHLPEHVAATTWVYPKSLVPITDSGNIKVKLHLPADGYEVVGIAQPR